jgi:hypothetical protein
MEFTTHDEYILTQSGAVVLRKVSEALCSNFETLIKSQLFTSGAFVPQILPKTDILFLNNDVLLVSQRLPELRFRTSFSLDPSGTIIQASYLKDQNSIAMDIAWRPPEDMLLFFIGAGTQKQRDDEWSFYLVAICKQDLEDKVEAAKQGVWLLPIPNQYDTGALCFNAHFCNDISKPCDWMETYNKALIKLSESPWASDPLFPEWKKVNSPKLFRWCNDDARAQLMGTPSDPHWTKYCVQVSVESLNLFFNHWGANYGFKI